MNIYDEKHALSEQCMMNAQRLGKFKLQCENRSAAMRQRMKFYNFFKFLEKIERQTEVRDIEEYKWAVRLLKMRKRITFKCHKIGLLELIWEGVDYEEQLLNRELSVDEKDKRVTKEDILADLFQVELEENAKRYGEGGDGLFTERTKIDGKYVED